MSEDLKKVKKKETMQNFELKHNENEIHLLAVNNEIDDALKISV